jgi:diguanylate cyclase (GGDEF)-like protein
VALQAVAPDPVFSPVGALTTPLPFSDGFDVLEERMWIATGFFPTVNNYVYFGGADGRFVGIYRRSDRIELRLRDAGAAQRHVYSVAGPNKRLALLRTDSYDPRTRPWFAGTVASGKENWSPVYTDFTTLEPTFTLSKPVYRADRTLVGVAATDMALTQLTDFFKSLKVSTNGIAFVVERSGAVIATSTDELPYTVQNRTLVRLMAGQSKSALVREAYEMVTHWQQQGESLERPLSKQFDSELGSIQVGATLLRDPAGLEWITIVAVPRADFIGNVTDVLYQSLAIGLVAVFLVLVLGFSLLQWVLRDIRKLTLAARSIGQGEPLEPLNIQRADEIGQLAKSFQEMERNLRTDRLTGVLNRDSLMAQIEFRIRTGSDVLPLKFVLLFIDLDGFKQINDIHGHDAGDRVLTETAQRLKSALRGDDAVARFGGDEFMVYLHGLDTDRAIEAVCDKIRHIVETPVTVRADLQQQVGASIGLACYPQDGRDIETLMRVADMRMLGLKRSRKAPPGGGG